MAKNDGGPAFAHGNREQGGDPGMSTRTWLAGQAPTNPVLCPGTAPEWQLQAWFGNRTGLTKADIASRQAFKIADAMLAQRDKP